MTKKGGMERGRYLDTQGRQGKFTSPLPKTATAPVPLEGEAYPPRKKARNRKRAKTDL